jgi:FlgD Ig-like domain
MGGNFLTSDAALLPVRPVAQREGGAWGNYRLYGDRYPATLNEPNGITITYYLRQASSEAPSVTVTDGNGVAVRKLSGAAKAGINRVFWNLDDGQGNPAPAGDYVVTLAAGGKTFTQPAKVVSRAPEDSPRPRRFGPGEN